MRSIPDTIARMAAMRARGTAGTDTASDSDRLSELAAFGTNPGSLIARTYVPGTLADGAPLVVVLHGCTQTAAAYDRGSGWSTLAESAGFAVLFAQQQRSNNANLCFNWFVPSDTRRESGEAQSIRQMIEQMAVTHRIDRKRIFVTGLSAGGAMACAMLAVYPEIFAGGAIIAGLPYGTATTVPQAFDRMRGHGSPSAETLQAILAAASDHAGPWPTLSIWHGDADATVSPSNAEAIIAQWREAHGAGEAPNRTEMVEGHRHKVWHDRSGRPAIETYSIAGMGHGTPIDPQDSEGGGERGPFMLDAGISSTRLIAAFWGIASPERQGTQAHRRATAASERPRPKDGPRPLEGEIIAPGVTRFRQPKASEPSHKDSGAPAPASAAAVIDRALRAAGLLR